MLQVVSLGVVKGDLEIKFLLFMQQTLQVCTGNLRVNSFHHTMSESSHVVDMEMKQSVAVLSILPVDQEAILGIMTNVV